MTDQNNRTHVQNPVDKAVSEALELVRAHRDKLLADKFNFLIQQRILVVEETQPVLTMEDGKVRISMGVDVKCREFERIAELVSEVEMLKGRVSDLSASLQNGE